MRIYGVKAHALAIVLCLSFGMPIFVRPSQVAEASTCKGEVISSVESSDKRWLAIVQEYVCSGEGLLTISITDAVQVVESGQVPTHENDVLVVDEGGHSENRPAISWASEGKLEITIPNKSLVGLQKQKYHDIDIALTYNPDDPAEREKFLRKLGLWNK
jgi:hypothetical protein